MIKQKVDHPERKYGFVTGAYSDGVLMDGFLFVSGQASIDFKTSKFILETIEEETHQTMENIKAIVEAAGGNMNHIVKINAYLADIHDFDRCNEVYAGYFNEIKPARTTVQSVLAEGVKVEIDCIVKLPTQE